MYIIFESQLYPDSLLKDFEINSKVILDYAAHNLCKSFLNGFRENNQKVFAVNLPNLGSFPFLYKSLFVKGATFEDGISIPFLNFTFLKRYDIKRRLKKEIEKHINNSNEEIVYVIIYNFCCLPFINNMKKNNPRLKLIMVVTDLPEFMLKPTSKPLSLLGKLVSDGTSFERSSLQSIDGFVLLAPAMAERMGINNKPWIQLEGVYNSDTDIGSQEKESFKTILYSGNLGLRYGIGTLLEAFHQIEDDNYRLWICGGGDGLEEVKRYCKLDSRIIYKGILPRLEVLKLQKRSTLLINPRYSRDDYTNYSFPSKTMEYLASGTPVMMSHLLSIPQDYDAHIYYVEDESVDGYKNKIKEICNKSDEELKTFGELASQFIYKNKTPKTQVAKLIDFIKTL